MAIKTYNDQNFVAIANAIRSKSKNPTTYKPSEMAAAISAIESGFELLPQDTVSGALANFPDGSDGYPVVELIANIEPKQAGSGDPAPDNVRPISGSTEVNVSKYGVNLLFSYSAFAAAYSMVGSTIENSGGGVRFSGVPTWTTGINRQFRIANVSQVKSRFPDARIKVFCESEYCTVTAANYNTNDDTIVVTCSTTSTSESITVDFYIVVYYGTAPEAFVPYSAPEVKTIDLGRTVYSGTLNVTTGLLTLTDEEKTYTGASNENWFSSYSGGTYRFYIANNNAKVPASGRGQLICNMGKFASSGNAVGACFIATSGVNNVIFYIPEQTIETVEDFKTWLSSNNLQFVYPLSNPIEIQLTPEQVKTLLGVNNISADTGNVSVTYRADVDLYIAKKIAEGA